MAVPGSSAAQTIAQLNSARNIALSDATHYTQIIPFVLPLIGTSAGIELRRWGSQFLAESFASPILAQDKKQELALGRLLEMLKEYLEKQDEETDVVKNIVQTAASVYPLIFRYIIANPKDAATWQTMAAIKSNILRRMDTAAAGVRICCIKFVQRVIQVQTPGVIADPRRPERNEISLALVPRDHPLIPPPNLEAEASGLLDRLLDILHLDGSDPLLVTATLNTFGVLIRTRASIANKIVSNVLNYNPLLAGQGKPLTPTVKVVIRSTERTVRALLVNITKKNPNHPLAGRIQQYVERLHQSRVEMFDEGSRKRPAPVEPTDGLDPAKRQRLGAEVNGAVDPAVPFPPLPPGPVSWAQLFTLTKDEGSKNFDVQALPVDLVNRILPPLLQAMDPQKMNNALNNPPLPQIPTPAVQPPTTTPPLDADDDDYEPEYPAEDDEQINNALDQAPADDLPPERPPDVAIGPFTLPHPPAFTEDETREASKLIVNRVLDTMSSLDAAKLAKTNAGFNRLAASSYDRDAWVTIMARLATRAATGLDTPERDIKQEDGKRFVLSDTIREGLFNYFVSDFKRKIDVAISWLNEEWYNDRVQDMAFAASANGGSDTGQGERPQRNYKRWLLRVIDTIGTYIEGSDKWLIRLLSEIPEVDMEVLERINKLANDPQRVPLVIAVMQYLIMLKPPAREAALDALESLRRDNKTARDQAEKLLRRWRPAALDAATNGEGEAKKEEQ